MASMIFVHFDFLSKYFTDSTMQCNFFILKANIIYATLAAESTWEDMFL